MLINLLGYFDRPQNDCLQLAIREHHVGALRREPCAKCGLPVFIAERLNVGKLLYHRTCFRCARCNSQLTLANYYETETKDQFCCEVCPDEEDSPRKKSSPGDHQALIMTRSLSDEEKSSTLKNQFTVQEEDDYSANFESALENSSDPSLKRSTTLTSVQGLEFSTARSNFFNSQIEGEKSDEEMAPALPKTKPPDINSDRPQPNNRSDDPSKDFVTLSDDSKDNASLNLISKPSDINRNTATDPEASKSNVVTKEAKSRNEGLSSIKARVSLFNKGFSEEGTSATRSVSNDPNRNSFSKISRSSIDVSKNVTPTPTPTKTSLERKKQRHEVDIKSQNLLQKPSSTPTSQDRATKTDDKSPGEFLNVLLKNRISRKNTSISEEKDFVASPVVVTAALFTDDFEKQQPLKPVEKSNVDLDPGNEVAKNIKSTPMEIDNVEFVNKNISKTQTVEHAGNHGKNEPIRRVDHDISSKYQFDERKKSLSTENIMTSQSGNVITSSIIGHSENEQNIKRTLKDNDDVNMEHQIGTENKSIPVEDKPVTSSSPSEMVTACRTLERPTLEPIETSNDDLNSNTRQLKSASVSALKSLFESSPSICRPVSLENQTKSAVRERPLVQIKDSESEITQTSVVDALDVGNVSESVPPSPPIEEAHNLHGNENLIESTGENEKTAPDDATSIRNAQERVDTAGAIQADVSYNLPEDDMHDDEDEGLRSKSDSCRIIGEVKCNSTPFSSDSESVHDEDVHHNAFASNPILTISEPNESIISNTNISTTAAFDKSTGRSIAVSDDEDTSKNTSKHVYPDDLNPFGDSDEDVEVKPAIEHRSLNPFEDDDDEEEEQPSITRHVASTSLNPFDDYDDDEAEETAVEFIKPTPTPRKRVIPQMGYSDSPFNDTPEHLRNDNGRTLRDNRGFMDENVDPVVKPKLKLIPVPPGLCSSPWSDAEESISNDEGRMTVPVPKPRKTR